MGKAGEPKRTAGVADGEHDLGARLRHSGGCNTLDLEGYASSIHVPFGALGARDGDLGAITQDGRRVPRAHQARQTEFA